MGMDVYGTEPKNEKGEEQAAKPNPYTEEEVERMQQLVQGVVGFDEARKDVVNVVQAKFEIEAPLDLTVPWHKDDSVLTNIKSAFLGLVFVLFSLLVIRPVVMHLLNRDKEAAENAATNLQLAQNEALALEAQSQAAEDVGEKELSASETLEEMKAKMKSKKELYNFLLQDCQAYLPPLDTTNVYFLKQIMRGNKEVNTFKLTALWT